MARRKGAIVNSTPPQTEVTCKELQEKFLQEDCPQSIKDEYFLLLRTYARSLALKEIKRKNIFLQPERVDEICTDATLALMHQYSKPGWKIRKSHAGALYWKIMEAMYKPANEDMVYSLNATFTENSDSKEVMDLVGSNVTLPWQEKTGFGNSTDDPQDTILHEVNASYSEIAEIVDEAFNMLPYSTFIRFLPWLVLQIRKPRTRNIQKLFNKVYLSGKEEDAFDILLLEIRNRILQHC